MENASKALIIAGAILIAILLISVGIMVMGATDDVTGGVEQEMRKTAIQQFNSKFDGYIGSGKSSAIVKNLITTVVSSNGTAYGVADGEGHLVSVNGATTNSEISALASGATSKETYTITVTANEQGFYESIIITGSKNGPLKAIGTTK